MSKATLHKAFLIGIGALLAGCAVLTVDVDVYKGPLANHKDIQMEQMAAMAIGAKPLLIELRDILEANYMNTLIPDELYLGRNQNCREPKSKLHDQLEVYCKYRTTSIETRLRILRGQDWYKPNFVEPYLDEVGMRRSYFLDSNADHVNNILCLYDDRRDVELLESRDTIFEMLERYRENYAILRPKDMTKDKDLVKGIRKSEKKLSEMAVKQTKEKALNRPTASDLLNAYEDYLNSDWRDALKVVRVTLEYLKTHEPNAPLLMELKSKDKSNENALNNVTNAAQNLLAETELVDVCADEIFGLKGTLRDQFVTRVKQIARAYLGCRADLEDVWLATMDGIICVNCQPVDPNESAERDEFTARMVDFSLEIIQPRYLAVVLDAAQKKAISKNIDDLAASLGPYPSADPNESNDRWDFERMKEVLAERLKKEPVETAKLLKSIHQFCKSALDTEKNSIRQYVGTGDLGSLGYWQGWKFGLVRAPFAELVELRPEDLMVGATKIEPQGGAFAGGRLDKGLETLIEEYLKQSNVYDPNDNELQRARERLSNALVGFAEKMLFVANNRSLMSPPKGDAGLLPETILGYYRLLLGQTFVDIMRNWGWIKFPLEETEQYTRILQAVGNSILVQADALHQERKHREQLEDHYVKEVEILVDTVSRMSPVHRDTVGIKPVHELLPENPTAKDVRDVWIELLEYEHDLALYYGETQRAKEIASALDAARKKREDMIFIRPAMAYLRTSFPSTSLQGNPNLTWDNMLGEHMMRNIPFAPQIGEFLNPDAKRDARITAEIDKQFWQNINRVRVAGGGFTNYAVVKDDIGNWYVKGYSANPEVIIQSAKNLAMFSLGAKMNTDLLTQINRKEGDLTGADDSDSALTSVEQLYEKYKRAYDAQIQTDRERLTNILKSSLGNAIKQAWQQNEDLKQLDGAIVQLEKKLDAATKLHLNNALDELKKSSDDADYGTEIIEALRTIIRFHNSLLIGIHDLDLTEPAKDELDRTKEELARARGELEKEQAILKDTIDAFDKAFIKYEAAIRVEQCVICDVTRIVREKLTEMITRRKEAVRDLETAIMFIGESNRQGVNR